MIAKGLRLVVFLGPLLLLLYLYSGIYRQDGTGLDQAGTQQALSHPGPPSGVENGSPPSPKDEPEANSTEMEPPVGVSQSHRRVFSLSSLDRKYFRIVLGSVPSRNPNIIPHPTDNSSWIVVAQQVEEEKQDLAVKKLEISCSAVFRDGALQCVAAPVALPIAPTPGGQCEGDMAVLNLLTGPHDARACWGPRQPYAIFGSSSLRNCLGQFTQDLRVLVDDWEADEATGDFRQATELQRPPPLGNVEKNWFFFWDGANRTHVHHDIVPKRVFSQINADGSSGPDLAPYAQASDELCLSRLLPSVNPEFEHIHQATNSLLVTLCDRNQPCVPDRENTIVFTIFHHKTFRNFHAVYEPYVLAFRQSAPFEVYGISRRPFWIHGRENHPDGASQMIYITSMSWKSHGLRYHGYMDDTLFLAFGIEDKEMGAIDVSVRDILDDLELC
jgi:hypothetical protein